MQIWGKVFGFFAGFMFGHIFGGLLGLYIGHRFDVAYSQNIGGHGGFDRLFPENNKKREAAFFYTTFAVMGHIAKSGGSVTANEIALANALMDKMNLSGDNRREAQDAFRDGKDASFPLKDHLVAFRRASSGRYDLLQMFLEIQIQAALADGKLEPEEQEILDTVAISLGFSHHVLKQLLDMHLAQQRFYQRSAGRSEVDVGKQLDDAYSLLGVSRKSSQQEVKRAYRKLMSQHHPDKLVAKGLPAEMMEMAKQKAQNIQEAYDLISEKAA